MYMKQTQKFKIFLLALIVTANTHVSFAAANCADIKDPPLPEQIVCPFIGIINITIGLVGAMIVVMCVYGGIKLSLSLGDPKGYAGAQNTWFWAVVGGGVVVLFYSGIVITAGFFGIKVPGPAELTDDVVAAIQGFLAAAKIY